MYSNNIYNIKLSFNTKSFIFNTKSFIFSEYRVYLYTLYKIFNDISLCVDDSDYEERISYKSLYEEVCVYTKAMRDVGICKGDVVACTYLFNSLLLNQFLFNISSCTR